MTPCPTHTLVMTALFRLLIVPLIFLSSLLSPPASANPATRALTSQIDEVIEAAAIRSGRGSLSSGLRKTLTEQVEKAAVQYGDDILKATESGGLELVESASRHSDFVWKACARVPEASRALALRADELVPLAKHYGDDVLRLEAREPGLASKTVVAFGQEGLETLARNDIPKADLYRILSYAGKADSPATAKQMLDGYLRDGAAFLERLPAKQIIAYGLSAAMVAGSVEISDGVGKAIQDSPEVIPATVGAVMEKLSPVLKPIGWACALAIVFFVWRWASRLTPEEQKSDSSRSA